MKTTKLTLLSIAIIAALPFTANAAQTIVETNTPAAVGANGTVKKAAATGPYQTATIGEHDDEHIATTAYVKGAYNDAIAAVNKVDSDKQDDLGLSEVMGTGDLVEKVMGYTVSNVSSAIANTSDKAVTAEGVIATIDEYDGYLTNDVIPGLLSSKQEELVNLDGDPVDTVVWSGDEILQVARQADTMEVLTDMAADHYVAKFLVAVPEVAGLVGGLRVQIYTTWGSDSTTRAPLVPSLQQ